MHKKRIVIIGAGISGLATAWFLQARFSPHFDITIVEQAERIGGWIRTDRIGGERLECGPRLITASGTGFEAISLISELGMADALVEPLPQTRRRYIARGGTLEPLPHSFRSLLFSPLGRVAARALLRKAAWRSPPPSDDESVGAFFDQRLGTACTRTFIEPMISGIYAGDPYRLSMRACFPTLCSCRSLPLAMWGRTPGKLYTLRDGLESFIQRIASRCQAQLFLGEAVEAIIPSPSHVEVITSERRLSADFCISSVAPCVLRLLLAPYIDVPEVPMASLCTVSLCYEGTFRTHPGFGFLAFSEEAPLLGAIFEPALSGTLLSVMLGGSRAPEVLDWPDDRLMAYAMTALQKYLSIDIPPSQHRIFRARNAISQYPVGYTHLLETLLQRLARERIGLVGAGFHGVSVGDAIRSARQMATSARLQKIAESS